MQWLLDNWLIVLLGVGMIGMHMFGHGGHGGHGGGKHKHSDPDATTDVVDQTLPQNQVDKDSA